MAGRGRTRVAVSYCPPNTMQLAHGANTPREIEGDRKVAEGREGIRISRLRFCIVYAKGLRAAAIAEREISYYPAARAHTRNIITCFIRIIDYNTAILQTRISVKITFRFGSCQFEYRLFSIREPFCSPFKQTRGFRVQV